MKEIITTGKTVELAIEEACQQMNVSREKVEFEIIDLPKKALFGLKTYPAKVRVFVKEEDKEAIAVEYVTSILKAMGVQDFTAEANKDGDNLNITLKGDDLGFVIGRRGETIDAIQYLVSLVANRNEGEYTRVSINVGNYRQKREETLRSLAKRNAARVLKNGRNVVLEPMNPYERRIIHTAVQEVEGVVSHSIGSDSDRRVVIALAEGVKPTGGSNGRGYGSRGRGGYDRRGGSRRGGERRQSQPQAPAVDRAPRSDVEGAFRYGKIEVNKDKE